MECRVFEKSENAFCRIKIDEFVSSSRLPSDIFVQLGERKFVMLAREGTLIDLPRLLQYKEKKISHLCVRNEDFHKYTGLNLKVMKALDGRSGIDDERRLQLYKHTGEILVRQVFISGLDESLCCEAQSILSNTLKIVGENEDLFELLLTLQASGDKLYSHSVGTAIYCCLIAQKMGWTSTPNQYKLTMAALFHDVGMREIPQELHDKPRLSMTTEEIRLRESHSVRSRDILASVKAFPADLVQIVLQHHENQLGAGYPCALPALRVHPLAKVLHMADDFSYLLIDRQCRTLEEAHETLKELFSTKGDEYDPAVLCALFEALGLEKPSQAIPKTACGA